MRKQVWKWRKPTVEGVRVLALDPAGHVILVRHSYGSDKWMPPGGGLKAGEDPVGAGARELLEETGCHLRDGRRVALSDEDLHGASNVVHVVVGQTSEDPVPDGREIVEARAFAIDALPEAMPAGLADLISGWIAAR
nr:NUDIX domain-containing protein [Novosphingobium profundi]